MASIVREDVFFTHKYTSSNFYGIIDAHWNNTLKSENIAFHLEELEWIGLEQITFFLSWIELLVQKKKYVEIILQSNRDILTTSRKYERRVRCLKYLIENWHIISIFPPEQVVFTTEIITNAFPSSVPSYFKFNVMEYKRETFDKKYDQLYEGKLKSFNDYVRDELKRRKVLNYFDNRFLNYSILKELYSNVCQHAELGDNGECYFSLLINKRIVNIRSATKMKDLLAERYRERSVEERAFFMDEFSNFKNLDYIEMCFLDLGKGIVNSLRNKYHEGDLEKLDGDLSASHWSQNEDSRILEYAFLTYTSKYCIEDDLRFHNYIPRGLFIVKDIVKRYKGTIIARSGFGKIVFDFSRTDDFVESVKFPPAEETPDKYFQGTSITILFPAKEPRSASEEQITYGKYSGTYEYRHVVMLEKLTNAEAQSLEGAENETQKKEMFNQVLFRSLIDELSKNKSAIGKSIYFFDFAGVEVSNYDVFHKVVYFLAFCPLINRKINACIINMLDTGISQSLDIDDALDSKGYFAKPIPVIHPNLFIEWIGMKDMKLQELLNQKWQGFETGDTITGDYDFLHDNILQVIRVENGETEVIVDFPDYETILQHILKKQRDFLKEEIEINRISIPSLIGEGKDYNLVKQTKYDDLGKQRAYLTSNGKYQTEFLTFIEKLYIRSYRRLLATYFYTIYCYEKRTDEYATMSRINKVITITLSSQLLGKEFVEIYNSARPKTKSIETSSAKKMVSAHLIPLSSYHYFFREEEFNQIDSNDNIISISDVISTGALLSRVDKFIKTKRTRIHRVLTIVDSRTQEEHEKTKTLPIASLYERPIDKFPDNPFGDTIPVWINPILNSATSLSRRKSVSQFVLFDSSAFCKLVDNAALYKVGLIKHNTRYHTYYLSTEAFLKKEKENNYTVTRQFFNELKNRQQAQGESSGSNFLGADDGFGFVFYPFMSSIQNIEEDLSGIVAECNLGMDAKTFPIPRIMTPKGWRFSFPPKFLNFSTKDKSVLIVDDGSSTGETIVQMIDTLSFLEISRIVVLSIFGRLEDFQREFFSRIADIKVKSSKGQYKTIPIQVFFATQFHIPVYSRNSHPFENEKAEIEKVISLYKIDKNLMLPDYLETYITHRLARILKPSGIGEENPISDIPDRIDRRLMFITRDLIGTYDSYRLYKEDEIDFYSPQKRGLSGNKFTDLVKEENGTLALIAVIFHEPYLLETIKQFYPELVSYLSEFILKCFKPKETSIEDTPTCYFFLKALATIDPTAFLNQQNLYLFLEKIEVLSKAGDSNLAISFFGYFFLGTIHNLNNDLGLEEVNRAKHIIQDLCTDCLINRTSRNYVNLLRKISKEISWDEIVFDSTEINAFHKVKQFYFDTNKNGGHKDSPYNTIQSYISKLQGNFQKAPTKAIKEDFKRAISDFAEALNNNLLINLRKISCFLSEFYISHNLASLKDPKIYLHLIQTFEVTRDYFKSSEFVNKAFVPNTMKKHIEILEITKTQLIDPNGELGRFFLSGKALLQSIINETQNTLRESGPTELRQRSWKDVTNKVPPNIKLDIHPYLFHFIVLEMLSNKLKYAPESDAKLLYKEDAGKCEIIYDQERDFIEGKIENGLSTIKNVVRYLGGECRIETEKGYRLNLSFPISMKEII